MKIILMRHGVPDVFTKKKMLPSEYTDWVNKYNRAGIIKDDNPPAHAIKVAQGCDYVVCSHLARSTDSAIKLGVTEIHVSDKLFREFEIPQVNWSWPGLTASNWTVLLRLIWMCGYSANCESFKQAKERAAQCMDRLVVYAREHGKVLFVGHGSLLWYLEKLLQKNGWVNTSSAPRRHWQYATYVLK